MDEAFVIMQIGNPAVDILWEKVYAPALRECGLEPKRVDKHSEGRLLQSEIADFIRRARIIIADLTNERPNCYLEVGYAMGLGKWKNLILCAKEDHHHESPSYQRPGPKIHFDLTGYSFLWWKDVALDEFRNTLIGKIRQRLAITEPQPQERHPLGGNEEASFTWSVEERKEVLVELVKLKLEAYFEITMQPRRLSEKRTVLELKNLAEQAPVHLSGWPIGVVLHNDGKPKPYIDSIRTSIAKESRMDYWSLHRDGKFYFLRTLEEDMLFKGNDPKKNIHFDTRIVRLAEAIMYCHNLYSAFGVSDADVVDIQFYFKGLANRCLAAANPHRLMSERYLSGADEYRKEVSMPKGALLPSIKDTVFGVAQEFATLFDFFDLSRGVCDDIVDKFMAGKY